MRAQVLTARLTGEHDGAEGVAASLDEHPPAYRDR
jgi:hypothetical protein